MLTPHHGENPELGEIRLTTEDLFDPVVFFRRQTMFGHHFGRHERIHNGTDVIHETARYLM
jgi:hypothetical protein